MATTAPALPALQLVRAAGSMGVGRHSSLVTVAYVSCQPGRVFNSPSETNSAKMSTAQDIQALLRFLSQDAKVPLAQAMGTVKALQQAGLGT